jgi:hypothetical protein
MESLEDHLNYINNFVTTKKYTINNNIITKIINNINKKKIDDNIILSFSSI